MIGVFDSGFGGLTIFRHIARVLPEYDYVYLGDSARAPYGNRSQETIYQFTVEAVDWLFKQGCELVVLACNTASSEALRKIQQEWLPKYNDPSPRNLTSPLLKGEEKMENDFRWRGQGEVLPMRRVLGVIRPVVEEAVRITKGQIGVVGTRATIASGAYTRELQKLHPAVTVFEQACPLLVPLIEEGWAGKPETKRILRSYLRPLKMKSIDTLILGCTHYPILLDEFVLKMGKRCRVLDPGPIVAASLKDYLARHPEMDARLSKKGVLTFATTDDPVRFNQWGGAFFGKSIKATKVVLS